jgi:periplasmic protein TonB
MVMKKVLVSFVLFFGVAVANAQIAKPVKAIPVAQYYAGGQDSLYAYINRTIVYPPYAKRNRISGEVILSFTLGDNGQITNLKCTKDVAGGGGLSKEAIRVLNLIKFTAPGFSSVQSIPFVFKL